MNQPTHHQIATYLTNYVLSELVKYVIEDTGCGIEQAMEKVYRSPLMEALQDEENELYVQSPAYLYELMNRCTQCQIMFNLSNQMGSLQGKVPVSRLKLI